MASKKLVLLADMSSITPLPLKKKNFSQNVKNIQHALNNFFLLKPFFCSVNLRFCSQDNHRKFWNTGIGEVCHNPFFFLFSKLSISEHFGSICIKKRRKKCFIFCPLKGLRGGGVVRALWTCPLRSRVFFRRPP